MNTVFEMFKKLGLRYVLITDRGVLMGVVTKKDILQHIAVTFGGHKRRTLPDYRDHRTRVTATKGPSEPDVIIHA